MVGSGSSSMSSSKFNLYLLTGLPPTALGIKVTLDLIVVGLYSTSEGLPGGSNERLASSISCYKSFSSYISSCYYFTVDRFQTKQETTRRIRASDMRPPNTISVLYSIFNVNFLELMEKDYPSQFRCVTVLIAELRNGWLLIKVSNGMVLDLIEMVWPS